MKRSQTRGCISHFHSQMMAWYYFCSYYQSLGQSRWSCNWLQTHYNYLIEGIAPAKRYIFNIIVHSTGADLGGGESVASNTSSLKMFYNLCRRWYTILYIIMQQNKLITSIPSVKFLDQPSVLIKNNIPLFETGSLLSLTLNHSIIEHSLNISINFRNCV